MHIGVWANFSRGLSQLCPKKFSTAHEKTAMLTCKITLPISPHRVNISKNLGFRALYLARQNEFRFFHLINQKNIFFIFGCWLLPEKFSFCPKNNGFAQDWGLQPPNPWLVRLWRCTIGHIALTPPFRFVVIIGDNLLKSLRLHQFKSDRDEI